MTRDEAIDTATSIVEKLGNTADLNSRGYKVDGWKPPTLLERTEAILAIASFLATPQPVMRLAAPGSFPARVFGWLIDGSEGPPSPVVVGMAKATLDSWATDRSLHPVAEWEAMRAAVDAELVDPHEPARCPGPPECM